jgi:hypothetical protein
MAGDLDFPLRQSLLAGAAQDLPGYRHAPRWNGAFWALDAEWALVWFLIIVTTAAWLAFFRKRPAAALA